MEPKHMVDLTQYVLHRPEVLADLQRGDRKINELMRGSAINLPPAFSPGRGGGEAHYVYRLIEGWACRFRLLDDGRKQLLMVFLPGDLLGISSMFVTASPDTLRTLSNVRAERIDSRVLHRSFKQDSDIAARCLWQIMEEERRLRCWVVGLGQGNAEERLALLLVEFRSRLARAGKIPSDCLSFKMPLTQVELADLLGITPVHVNRVLKSLRERGVVHTRGGEVQILDWEALFQCARSLMATYEHTNAERVRQLVQGEVGAPA